MGKDFDARTKTWLLPHFVLTIQEKHKVTERKINQGSFFCDFFMLMAEIDRSSTQV
jgi:hypothetical protein